MLNGQTMIETKNLKKNFLTKQKGKKILVEAVKGVDLNVRKGEIFGFLGPNGAGKSTTKKMLSTLLAPTDGLAFINGYDLKREKHKIRTRIGYVSQAGGTDSLSTGWENLILQARLYGLNAITAKERAKTYIDRFRMGSFADRIASVYSGGQRRRLDIALGMIHRPSLLLLDEPTAGLDPQSRAYLWDEIRNLKNDGVTIFLTTHYMDEADKLCDTVAIINNGLIAAQGTPDTLKNEIGADIITIGFHTEQDVKDALTALKIEKQVQKFQAQGKTLFIFTKDMGKALPQLLHTLSIVNLKAQSISFNKPSLDDVFLKHTGRSLREDESK